MTVPVKAALRIPAEAHCLVGFRRWAQTEGFPEGGRIDFLKGDIEVDVSPEDLYTHGTLTSEITTAFQILVAHRDMGCVFTDRTRISNPAAALSAEPDVVVVFWDTLDSGRVREIPAVSKKPGRYVELEGAPDLVVEILSDSSEQKDLKRLPQLYAEAAVPELWLIDARGKELRFEIHTLETGSYRHLRPQRGWSRSVVLSAEFRLERRRVRGDRWSYRLRHRFETRST
jgi:Uma2 family endonuclease